MRERETERVQLDFRIALKKQAGNIDAAAGMDRKVRNRCRRAKGRFEKRVSTGMD